MVVRCTSARAVLNLVARHGVGNGLRSGRRPHRMLDTVGNVIAAGNSVEKPGNIAFGKRSRHLDAARHAQIGKARSLLLVGQAMVEGYKRKAPVCRGKRHEYERRAVGHIDRNAGTARNAEIAQTHRQASSREFRFLVGKGASITRTVDVLEEYVVRPPPHRLFEPLYHASVPNLVSWIRASADSVPLAEPRGTSGIGRNRAGASL